MIPFANATLVEHFRDTVAITAYVGLVCAASTVMAVLWAYLALISKTIEPRIGTAFRWLVLVRFLVMPPLFSFISIWVGQHYGIVPSIALTAVIAAVAGRFGVKPVPAEPEVREV